jgi:hypothetical protein
MLVKNAASRLSATEKQILMGKQYARGLPAIKTVQDALFKCFYTSM